MSDALREFEGKLSSIKRFSDLANFVANRPMQALHLSSSAVLVDMSNEETFAYRHYAGEWTANVVDSKLKAKELERCFTDASAVVRAPLLAISDGSTILTPPPFLGLPVRINGELRGVVLYGGHVSGAAFLAEEIELLRLYVDASVRVLAQLYIKNLESALASRL